MCAAQDPQSALDAPRFCITADGSIAMEDGIPPATLSALQNMGHEVKSVDGFERSMFGRGQWIGQSQHHGVWVAGSDGRADGCAMGY